MSDLDLTIDDDGGDTVVVTATADQVAGGAAPITVIGEEGQVVATCAATETCSAEVPRVDSNFYMAKSGDVYSEPVTVANDQTTASAPSVEELSRATFPLPTTGEETRGTDAGWDIVIGTRPIDDDLWGASPVNTAYGSSAWYEFYASASGPLDDGTGSYSVRLSTPALGVTEPTDDGVMCWDFVSLDISCENYKLYSGVERHDVVADVVDAEHNVVASLTYGGWHDRYFGISLHSEAGWRFSAGEPVRLTATSSYAEFPWSTHAIYIQETTTGDILARCTSSPCVVDGAEGYFTGERAFRTFAADRDDPAVHVAASTSYYPVSRIPWWIGLSQYGPVQGGRVPVIAPMTQNVGLTGGHYAAYIVDVTAGRVVKTCSTGQQCYATVDVSKGHAYAAVVASSDGVDVDVQATSGAQMTFASDGGTIRNGPRWETSGGTNPSVPSCQTCAGDPVNTFTGEFWDSFSDLSLGRLEIRRSYGSTLASVDQGWGHGWSSNLGMKVEKAASSPGDSLADAMQLVVVQENGSFVPFARTDDGFATAHRVQAELEEREDGSFAFQRRDGVTYLFSADGDLTEISDRNGNTQTVTWVDGRVARIADDRGRHIDLTWTGEHVTSVTDGTGREVGYTYDSAGNLTAVTDVTGATTSYEYDSEHQVVAFTDARGARVENVYAGGRVVEQTDALGRVMTFEYRIDAEGDGTSTVTNPDGSRSVSTYEDGAVVAHTVAEGSADEATTTHAYLDGLRVASTDPTGATTTITYDERGNVTSETDSLGRTTSWAFDSMDLPLVTTRPSGAEVHVTYDDRGNPTQVTAPSGATTTYSINPDGSLATSSDPLGRETVYGYDVYGTLSTVQDPSGSVMTTESDVLGRALRLTDGNGHVSEFEYDDAGRLVSSTDPAGGVSTAEYDTSGYRTRVVEADGAVSSWEYDLAGQAVASVDPAGARTTFAYDDAGRVALVTYADGTQSGATYDAAGQLARSTDPLGRETTFGYDLAGRLVTQTTPSGARTTIEYDAAGQQLATSDALGAESTTAYHVDGRPSVVTDPDGRSVEISYDLDGRIVSLERGDGSVVAWAYDAAGQQESYTDAAGRVTGYTYDASGYVTSRTDTAGRVVAWTYDAVGNMTSQVAGDGTVTAQTYDDLDRLVGIAAGATEVSYAYDAVGRRASMTDSTGVTEYAYDAAGRLTGTDGATGQVAYQWDSLGRLVALTYPDGDSITRAYDDAGQLSTVTDWSGDTYGFTWTQDGALEQVVYPNAVATTVGRDLAGQVSTMTSVDQTGAELLDLAYTYSDSGLQTSSSTTRPGVTGQTSEYAWDAQARLDAITGTLAGQVDFTAGDEVALLPDGTALTYDAAGQLVEAVTAGTSTTLGHDGRGNRITQTAGALERTYEYDAMDRLVGLADTDGPTWTYAYDGDGLRVASTTTDPDGESIERAFTWAVTGPVPLLLSDGEHEYLYGVGTAPLAQRSAAGVVAYLHGDLIGSIRSLTGENGEVLAESNYGPYGTALTVDHPSEAVADATRFGFAGEYVDESGLIYLRARYYDSNTGQFLTRDPLESTTKNAYGYTGGNPIQFVDPLGLDWLENLSNFSAGFGDTVTFGGTRKVRQWMGTDGVVDVCSTSYRWGGLGSEVVGMIPMSGARLGGGAVRGSSSVLQKPTSNFVKAPFRAPSESGNYSARTPATSSRSDIPYGPGPLRAWDTIGRVDTKGSPVQGRKGGSVFHNKNELLPARDSDGDVTYREWDVNDPLPNGKRDAERVVTGSDGSAYFTTDHYDSFLMLRGPSK